MKSDTDNRARKIRALLDKAEATAFPAEAEALTAKATALMASWQITDAMLASAAPSTDRGTIITRDIELGKGPYVHARLALLGSAGAFQQCRVLTSTGWNGRVGHLVGFTSDVERAEMLFTSLLLQATTAVTAAPPPDPSTGLTTTSWRRNFLLGFARVAGERLRDATESAVAEAEAQQGDMVPGPSRAGTTSVAMVLADRMESVDSWVAAEHGRLGTTRPARASSAAGWNQGQRAAQRADLGAGARIGGRRHALGR